MDLPDRHPEKSIAVEIYLALWAAKMIGRMIQQQFDIKVSKASVCRLLNHLGLTPQRPIWRAYPQKPEEVQRWLNEEYPRIKEMAKRQKAIIFFGGEAVNMF